MPTFKRKAIMVVANQWQPGATITGVIGERPVSDGSNGLSPEPASAFVRTRSGTVQVFSGDWVVTFNGPPIDRTVMHDADFVAAYDPFP